MDDVLNSAILKIKQKIMPHAITPMASVQEPEYRQLYKLLQVFDIPDEATEKQIDYIYNFLIAKKLNPKEELVNIHTKIGAIPTMERLVDKIYRYCQLSKEVDIIRQRTENLERDINALSNNR